MQQYGIEWKDAALSFFISPGSAQALVRWGGKMKYLLISYFLRKIYAKHYQNRLMCVWAIVRQSVDTV